MHYNWPEKVTCWYLGFDKQQTAKVKSQIFLIPEGCSVYFQGVRLGTAISFYPHQECVFRRLDVLRSMALLCTLCTALISCSVQSFMIPWMCLTHVQVSQENNKKWEESVKCSVNFSYSFLISWNLNVSTCHLRFWIIRLRIFCLTAHHRLTGNICCFGFSFC